jgi:hypothetical protein
MYLEEQRKAERFASDIMVEEIDPQGGTKFSKAINISKSGALLVSEEPNPKVYNYAHPSIWLQLHLPDYEESIVAQVKVVHAKHDQGKYFRGVRFRRLSDDHRMLLNAYTAVLRTAEV